MIEIALSTVTQGRPFLPFLLLTVCQRRLRLLTGAADHGDRYLSHSASFDSRDKNAPSKSGTKQLAGIAAIPILFGCFKIGPCKGAVGSVRAVVVRPVSSIAIRACNPDF
jgi:hypothetical protein